MWRQVLLFPYPIWSLNMWCLLMIQCHIDILPQFLQLSMQYLTILDRVITALDCIMQRPAILHQNCRSLCIPLEIGIWRWERVLDIYTWKALYNSFMDQYGICWAYIGEKWAGNIGMWFISFYTVIYNVTLYLSLKSQSLWQCAAGGWKMNGLAKRALCTAI